VLIESALEAPTTVTLLDLFWSCRDVGTPQ